MLFQYLSYEQIIYLTLLYILNALLNERFYWPPGVNIWGNDHFELPHGIHVFMFTFLYEWFCFYVVFSCILVTLLPCVLEFFSIWLSLLFLKPPRFSLFPLFLQMPSQLAHTIFLSALFLSLSGFIIMLLFFLLPFLPFNL